ncbi:hypothetical protein ACFHWS_01715 [Micromonospora sp. LOL_013]|uniref:hypothetical protein n=1 Tax=Micromonospora sp. LOL_013 TaxID=3345414 RepID=UPI003A877180
MNASLATVTTQEGRHRDTHNKLIDWYGTGSRSRKDVIHHGASPLGVNASSNRSGRVRTSRPAGRYLAHSAWHPAEVEEWTYNGTAFQINSMYLLPEDAWTYELTGWHRTSGAVAVVIPDTTPDGEPFTPTDATHAYVAFTEGPLPWPVLLRFIRFVEASGDIMSDPPTATTTVSGDLSQSLNSWRFESQAFEVTSYHDSQHDGRRYELYEANPTNNSHGYIDVRIPDLQPDRGPFVPAPAGQVTVTGHRSPTFPWPVFRRFLDAILASGDIRDDQEG